VKHAYGATSRYAPAVIQAHQLITDGLIGDVQEIELLDHVFIPPLIAYYEWVHRLDQGGGLLNNGFTHKLAQVLRLTDATVEAVTGEARRTVEQAPTGPTMHDFRELFTPAAMISSEQASAGEWHEVDADFAYTVLARLRLPNGHTTSALFHSSFAAATAQPNYLAVYGTEGTLLLTGPNAPDRLQHMRPGQPEWDDVALPQEIAQMLPLAGSPEQRDWNMLVRDFVTDIRGGDADYPTFRDGWIAMEIIDSVRSGAGWMSLPKAQSVIAEATV
jgi:predicted dehydrogenase